MVFKIDGNEIYETIKAELLSGAYPMGCKIDLAQMADTLHISTTPVRENLMRLVGEQLVQAVPHLGFFMPRATDAKLRRLVDWSQYQLMPVIRETAATFPGPSVTPVVENGGDPIRKLEQVLVTIAAIEGNPELKASLARTNDRLHIPRQAGAATRADREAEVDHLISCLLERDFIRLESLIVEHHEKLRLEIPRIVESLESDANGSL